MYSFEQFVYNTIENFPELEELKNTPLSSFTFDQKVSMSQRVAKHLFCVLGNGYDWDRGYPYNALYEKAIGTPTEKLYKKYFGDLPHKDTPHFPYCEYNQQFDWGKVIKESPLGRIAGLTKKDAIKKVDFSYAKAAVNVAFSMAKYSDFSDPNRKMGLDCLKSLVYKYPATVTQKISEFLK